MLKEQYEKMVKEFLEKHKDNTCERLVDIDIWYDGTFDQFFGKVITISKNHVLYRWRVSFTLENVIFDDVEVL